MEEMIRPADGHQAVELLLPWYATAQLDQAETAIVAAHLASCAECRAMLQVEQRLKQEPASESPRTDVDWAAFKSKLGPTLRRPLNPLRQPGRATRQQPARLGRGFAVPLAAAAAAVLAVMLMFPSNPAPYRTLSAAAAPPTGNIIVMFRPDMTEERLRAILHSSSARLVDGPTTANAYVLLVPGGKRLTALARLRAQPGVTLAEPIDAAPAQ